MRASLLWLLSLTSLAHAEPAPIVGGLPSIAGEFPTVVALAIVNGNTTSSCTGTLVTKDWVLTAAHCVSPMEIGLSQAEITADLTISLDTIDTRVGTMLTAAETIPDPDYVSTVFGSHDIGLVRLATPVTDRATLAINFDAGNAPIGTPVITVGFGDNHLGFEFELAHTSIACAPAFDDAQVLCFPESETSGIGGGDSGGPSFAMIGSRLVQVGVSSFVNFANPDIGAMQRVDAEASFILAHIPELDCTHTACPGDLTCQQHTCLAQPCMHDSDCTDPEVCFHDACVPPPNAPTGLGANCRGGGDCSSGDCFAVITGDGPVCVTTCLVDSDCPSGFGCETTPNLADDASGNCTPEETVDNGGCSCGASGGPPWLGVLLVLLLRRRR